MTVYKAKLDQLLMCAVIMRMSPRGLYYSVVPSPCPVQGGLRNGGIRMLASQITLSTSTQWLNTVKQHGCMLTILNIPFGIFVLSAQYMNVQKEADTLIYKRVHSYTYQLYNVILQLILLAMHMHSFINTSIHILRHACLHVSYTCTMQVYLSCMHAWST